MRQFIPAVFVLCCLIACGGGNNAPAQIGTNPAPGIINAAAPTPTQSIRPSLEPTRPLIPPESLSTEEMHQRLDPFASQTPDCMLPCYNGLIMGQASVNDVYDFYAHLGIGLADLIPGDYPGIEDGTGRLGAWLTKSTDAASAADMGLAAPLVSIYVSENIAETLYVGWEYYPRYLTLPIVLEQLGQPDQLDLAMIFAQSPPAFLLQLIYTEERIGFAFLGESLGDLRQRQVCFSDAQVKSVSMGLFAPGIAPMEGVEGGEYLLPLEATLSLPYIDFAAKVAAGECLDIPAALWPQWQALGGG